MNGSLDFLKKEWFAYVKRADRRTVETTGIGVTSGLWEALREDLAETYPAHHVGILNGFITARTVNPDWAVTVVDFTPAQDYVDVQDVVFD